MLRNMTEDGRLTGGQSSSSPAGHGVPSSRLVSQESPWMGLLSVLSRPALSFLQNYFPGRSQTPGTSDGNPELRGTGFQNKFIDEERDFLDKLDHVMPLGQHAAAHLTYLRCQQDGAAGPLEHEPGSAAPWITAASLREIGIEDSVTMCPQTETGYLSSVKTVLGHVLMNPVSAQELRPAGGANWARGSKEGPQWGSLWGGGDTSHRVLFSDLSWIVDETNGPQQQCSEPDATETTCVFVQRSSSEESTLGEHTGASEHNEPTDNGVQSTEPTPPDLSINNDLSSTGGAVCAETPLLTPDQDNGYSSLEEEHFHLLKTSSEETQPATENCAVTMESGEMSGVEEHTADEGRSVVAAELSTPECQNKAIAFIMGCPCSDDESSQSELSDDDDDDGFDSEGSSELSESSDSDSDSDSDVDSESERLMNSLFQTLDPYNPQNFRAQLHSTPPRSIPVPTPPSSAQSTPDPSPNLTSPASSPPVASSPPSDPDTWDDSTSASEADEAESSRLWSSFNCTSDPYSPFNFQASYRTQEPNKAAPRARTKKAPQSLRHKTVLTPECSKDEIVELQERGETATSSVTSDPSPSSSFSDSPSAASTKKVRFCDHVEEIFLGSEEDRRGPWEELARDRCRFQRRCLEVEESIGFCLQPQHRLLVYSRITVLVQEEEHALQHVTN